MKYLGQKGMQMQPIVDDLSDRLCALEAWFDSVRAVANMEARAYSESEENSTETDSLTSAPSHPVDTSQ